MSTSVNLVPKSELDGTQLEKLHIAEQEEEKGGTLGEDELETFRNQWRNEVQAKRKEDGSASRAKRKEGDHAVRVEVTREVATPSLGIKTVSPVKSNRPLALSVDPEEPIEAGPSRRTPATVNLRTKKVPKVPGRVKAAKDEAVELYTKAVDKEQSGQLSEALMLYRKAFKLDDSVDQLYTLRLAEVATREEILDHSTETATPSSTDVVSAAVPIDEPYSFQKHMQLQPDYEKAIPLHTNTSINNRTSPLTALLTSLPIPPSETNFLPLNEKLPLPIAQLPSELLDPIFSHLDVTTLERFASTCWRARYLAAISDVWKRIALDIYKSPRMVPEGWIVKDMARKHRGEWRTTVVEEERVRMDGCYISVCHYVRPGAGDQWVAITHMITYHRFLRFYPDGSVLSFLTTDHPSEVVPVLRRSLRGKGLHVGRWQLLRSDHDPNDQLRLASQHEKRHAKIIINELLEPGAEVPKYEFEMELALRETGRGRWNKLDISSYSSINLATGEALGLSLKHQKPFYFSKVKSYNPPF